MILSSMSVTFMMYCTEKNWESSVQKKCEANSMLCRLVTCYLLTVIVEVILKNTTDDVKGEVRTGVPQMAEIVNCWPTGVPTCEGKVRAPEIEKVD